MSVANKIITDKIETTEISEADQEKIQRDLRFINAMSKQAKEVSCRLVVSGGYSTDGSLGKLTRPHRDIDIQVFGQNNNAVEVVNQLIASMKEELSVEDKGRQEYYHSFFAEGDGLGSDIYYIQVTGDPFSNEKYVVKNDGTQTEKQDYNTVEVELGGVNFEVTSPASNLKDILLKRDRGDNPKPEHEQDIRNLKLLTGVLQSR